MTFELVILTQNETIKVMRMNLKFSWDQLLKKSTKEQMMIQIQIVIFKKKHV